MLTILCISVVVLIILIAAEYKLYYSSSLKDYRKVPGLKRLPILGSIKNILSSQVKLFYYARNIANVFRNKRNICKGQVISMKLLNLYEPDDIEKMLTDKKNLQKGFLYDIIHPWLKEGLLTSKGQKWHMRRKMLTPAFHFNILKQFVTIFQEKSENLVKDLQNEVDKMETEIYPIIAKFSIHVICETAMGTNLELIEKNVEDYKQSVEKMGEIFVKRVSRFWLFIPLFYMFSSTYREEKRVLERLHGFTTSVIRERRSKAKDADNTKECNTVNDDSILGIKEKRMMLDMLLKSEADGVIDEKGIREEVDTFMFAGHDTTSDSLTYTLMLLANYPEVQKLVVKEIDEIIENSNQPLTLEDYNKMNYLEMCIKESLRLYPSVPIISRHLTEDLQLKDYLIPSGVTVLLQIFDLHRNPNLYPDPDKFCPERFLPENIKNRHPYAYIPFSAGPRNCIGQKFALIQEKVVLSTILRKFKLEPVTRHEDIIFVSGIILRTTSPVKVKFVNRD